METKMKIYFTSVVLSLAIMQVSHADLVSDSEQIMNDAETVYRDLFPSNQTTQIFDPYRYRFYPSTGIYLGVNQNDAGVYLLGGSFGDTPKYVDQTDKVISMLKTQMGNEGDTSNSKSDICDTSNISDDFTYRREGNTTYISTDGQCIAIPEDRNTCETLPEIDENRQPIETGIHVLSQSSVSKFEITGLNIPGFDSTAQSQINQKTCVIHAPRELTNQTIHSDICLDMTSQLGSLPGATPPVTNRFKSTVSFAKVDDCFKSDAAIITNLVTKEGWVNQNGAFVKAN